jgi:hypothetical protein
MIDTAVLLALLTSSFLLIVPVAALTRRLLEGVRADFRSARPVRVATPTRPRRGAPRG